MARRDAVGDPSTHDLVGQLAVAPLADWSTRAVRLLTCQRKNLAHLLWAETWLDTGPRLVRQPPGDADFLEWYFAPRMPAPPPQSHSLDVHGYLLGDIGIAVAHGCQQHHPCASHERLPRLMGAHQAFQLAVLRIAQHNLRRLRSRHPDHPDLQDASS